MTVFKTSCPRCGALSNAVHCNNMYCAWRVCKKCSPRPTCDLVFSTRITNYFLREK